jgi:hypothetical protein
MVMFRGLADDLALVDWHQNIFRAGEPCRRRSCRRARLAAVEMIESGTDLRRHVT